MIDLHIPAESATLRHLVEMKMREAIALGMFKPGERLIERDLCARLGVGRTSIREALRQLEAEGLVTSVPHRGPVVSIITVDEARQLYDVRALIESHAGRVFAASGNDDLRDALTRAVKLFLEAAKVPDRQMIITAKAAFYEALMAGAGNVFLTKMHRSLTGRITLLRVTSMMQEGRLLQSVAEIKEIHRTILAQDPDAAAEACRYHVEQAAATAIASLV